MTPRNKAFSLLAYGYYTLHWREEAGRSRPVRRYEGNRTGLVAEGWTWARGVGCPGHWFTRSRDVAARLGPIVEHSA